MKKSYKGKKIIVFASVVTMVIGALMGIKTNTKETE